MRRAFERTLQVLLWGLGVTIVWAVVALTSWGAAQSPIGAGPGYVDRIRPLTFVGGAIVVCVSGTLLVQTAVASLRRGRPSQRQGAASRVVSARTTAALASVQVTASAVGVIERGRTWQDLPAEPPAQPARAAADTAGP